MLDEAIEIEESNETRLKKGILCEKQSPGSGILYFRLILSQNPDCVEAIWRLGNSLICRGEIQLGLEEFTVFVRIELI